MLHLLPFLSDTWKNKTKRRNNRFPSDSSKFLETLCIVQQSTVELWANIQPLFEASFDLRWLSMFARLVNHVIKCLTHILVCRFAFKLFQNIFACRKKCLRNVCLCGGETNRQCAWRGKISDVFQTIVFILVGASKDRLQSSATRFYSYMYKDTSV